MISKCLLLKPKRAGKKSKRFTKNWTLDRFEKWKSGNFVDLWHETLKYQNTSNRNHESSLESEQLRRCISLAREGNASKSLSSLSSTPIAPSNDITFERLKSKHPTEESPKNLADCNPPEHINFNVDQIMNSFPKSTAAGPSGLRIDHIKEALSLDKNPNSDFSNLLKNFINYLISGSVPSQLKYYIGGARLIALEKPNKDLRPIAIGESFRRIASKVMCQACQSDIQDYFSNIQHGNQKRGCETIVHKIKSEIESLKNWCLLKVDITNAFNSVKRKTFLDQMSKVFPKAYNWSKWLYEEKTPLQFAKYIIWSETGVQQGDPLGPLLFCAAIRPILEQIHRECGLDINAWYMDDGNLLGDPDKLLKAWEILST